MPASTSALVTSPGTCIGIQPLFDGNAFGPRSLYTVNARLGPARNCACASSGRSSSVKKPGSVGATGSASSLRSTSVKRSAVTSRNSPRSFHSPASEIAYIVKVSILSECGRIQPVHTRACRAEPPVRAKANFPRTLLRNGENQHSRLSPYLHSSEAGSKMQALSQLLP